MKTDKVIVINTTEGEILIDADDILYIKPDMYNTATTTGATSTGIAIKGLSSTMIDGHIYTNETPLEIMKKIREVEVGRKSPAMYLTSNLQLERELVSVLAEEWYETKKPKD